MKVMNTDVAIVAGGPAGLAAAITAGENGLSSILFEKANTTGGAANMGMGPLGIGTKIQKLEFKDLSVEEAYDIHMIDSFECTKCGKCIEACDEDAIIQTSGRVPKLPSRLIKCGKFR